RIPDPIRPEFGPQPFGDAEDAAEAADVLTEDEHVLVVGQAVAQCPVERLRHRHRFRGRARLLSLLSRRGGVRLCARVGSDAHGCPAAGSSASRTGCCAARAGRGWAYTWAKSARGSISASRFMASRTAAARASAAALTSSAPASSSAPVERRYFSTLSMGSNCFQCSTSSASRYFVGSSEFVCDSIR